MSLLTFVLTGTHDYLDLRVQMSFLRTWENGAVIMHSYEISAIFFLKDEEAQKPAIE